MMLEKEAQKTAKQIRQAAKAYTHNSPKGGDTLLQALLYDRANEIYTCAKSMHDALSNGDQEAYTHSFLEYSCILAPVLNKYVELCMNPILHDHHNEIPIEYLKRVMSSIIRQASVPDPVSKMKHEFDFGTKIHPYSLTDREKEVLELISLGLSNKKAAEQLMLSEGTVKLHLHRIYSKLHTKGRVHAIRKAKQLMLIP